METLDWGNVEKLRGKCLTTLAQGKPFRLDEVGGNSVAITLGRCETNGQDQREERSPRPITRDHLERAYELRLRQGTLRPVDLANKGILNFNSSYIVAIIEKILSDAKTISREKAVTND